MKEQANTTYKLVRTPHSSPSETTITEEIVENHPLIMKKAVFSKKIKSVGLSLLLLGLGLLLWTVFINKGEADIPPTPTFTLTQSVFKFQVYCPMSYFAYLPSADGSISNQPNKYGPYEVQPSSIQGTDFDPSKTYIITIISTEDESGTPVLQYCGLAREWNDKCTEPIYTCTSPGPMFDFLVGSTVDVIWINQLNPKFVPPSPTALSSSISCMDPTKDQVYCSLNYRADNDAKIFKSPINMHQKFDHDSSASMRMGPSDWPASIHIHGLQVRPQFDGNPLSWFSNSGKKGEGIIPLDKQCYFDSFNNSKRTVPPNIKFTNSIYNSGTKVNRYINDQSPGNLWYHDHSMHLTQYNVANGFYGIYIIRDPKIQRVLPTGGRQKFLLKTVKGWANQSFSLFESEVTYRYRILNSDTFYITQVSFTSEECSKPNFTTIPFTIIGADSSLFNETMPNISRVQLGSAERVQLLITFEKSMQSFQICQITIDNPYPDPDPDTVEERKKNVPIRKYQIIGSTHYLNTNKEQVSSKQSQTQIRVNQVQSLGVPFTNLSLVKDKDIKVFRMRPLMVTTIFNFMVNGHHDFHQGAHQNPTVGSIQDWYIINTINEAHPIHVHLIVFQVTQILKLRHIVNYNPNDPVNDYCSFYEMDFLLQAIVLNKNQTINTDLLGLFVNQGKIDYSSFCSFYKGSGNITLTINNQQKSVIWDDLYYDGIDVSTYNVNKQDEIDQKTRTSGIDVRELIQKGNSSYLDILETTNCPYNNTHKYLCRQSTNHKPWYQRWKDTALIDPMTAFKYRIRWTKASYVKGGPYFQSPIDQLMQFPGYVYHCHILGHEDDQMMRAIMLQPPEDDLHEAKRPWKCHQQKWEDKYLCLNQQCTLSEEQDNSMILTCIPPRKLQQQ